MDKYAVLGILSLLGMYLSCSNGDDLTQEEEQQGLNELMAEIQDLASSVDCTDSTEWRYISYGSKACGGPLGYIAYSNTIDTVLFLDKVREYTMAQKRYNEKWGVISDCSLPSEPRAIRCENGMPVFGY